uniref:Uncharacterized protein n=1 Tax=Ralstonia solanacearum TaxID=305 RepID=A0A0S4TVI1_RALSL|nr:conserved exported protein of unknown function [Ralstonia solanacearum]
MRASTRAGTGLVLASVALMLTAGITRAQAVDELSPALLGELMGFVQNAYFNANRLSEMPKFPTQRAATQPEVLRAVADALRVRQRTCTSVISANYADDSGNNLVINCVGGSYMVDAKRGKITP